MKPDKIKDFIEQDHLQRIANNKKLMTKDPDLYEAKAKEDIKKRKYYYTKRPPYSWNFFDDGNAETKVDHVLRHDSN